MDDEEKLKAKEEIKLHFMNLLSDITQSKLLKFRYEVAKFVHKLNFDLIEKSAEELDKIEENKNIDALFSILDQLDTAYNDIMSGDTNENG